MSFNVFAFIMQKLIVYTVFVKNDIKNCYQHHYSKNSFITD